jgi:hypothetical protein
MLSWKIFIKAEKLRQALGERHFGHFDRDAVHLHGPVENEAEPIPSASDRLQFGAVTAEPANFVLSCRIERDSSSGNLTPTIRVD